MAERQAGVKLAAYLWFLAAALALNAFPIGYSRRDELNWTWAAAGAFTLVMGISAWRRARSTGTAPPGS
ncbi:MAG: hypothetical protein ACT4PJ_03110 [Gemmatimonadaceae bacterium]